jgi:hypothetical protein
LDQKIPLISPEFNLPHFEQSLKQTPQKLWTDSARDRFNVAIADRRIEAYARL